MATLYAADPTIEELLTLDSFKVYGQWIALGALDTSLTLLRSHTRIVTTGQL